MLYIVDAATGELLHAVEADDGPGQRPVERRPIDYDGDAIVDYIYAGDLQGKPVALRAQRRRWLGVSFGGKPLFRTGTEDIVTETTDNDPGRGLRMGPEGP